MRLLLPAAMALLLLAPATTTQKAVKTIEGMAGGDSLGKMMSDSGSIGEDIAKFLARWARGESLD